MIHEKVRALLLLVPAVIHLLPLSGLLGAQRLEALYGLTISDPNLLILMQHRAVLFGLLGGFLLIAAFRPAWQDAAIVAGLISTISFLVIAWSVGDTNAALSRVLIADVIAMACLLGAASWRLVESLLAR